MLEVGIAATQVGLGVRLARDRGGELLLREFLTALAYRTDALETETKPRSGHTTFIGRDMRFLSANLAPGAGGCANAPGSDAETQRRDRRRFGGRQGFPARRRAGGKLLGVHLFGIRDLAARALELARQRGAQLEQPGVGHERVAQFVHGLAQEGLDSGPVLERRVKSGVAAGLVGADR